MTLTPLCSGVDSTVYLNQKNGVVDKRYSRLREEQLKEYHSLQNTFLDTSIIIDKEGIYQGNKFEQIEIKILKLEDDIKEVKNKIDLILGLYFETTKYHTKQKAIKGKTLLESNNKNDLGYDYKEIKNSILMNIYKNISEKINYKRDDINPLNIMITGVENGKLICVVTDIGADIKDLLKRNKLED